MTICLVAVYDILADTLLQLMQDTKVHVLLKLPMTHDSKLWNHEQPVHDVAQNVAILESKALHASSSCFCFDRTAC